MALRPDEISALIKEQIKHYDDVMEQKDVGTVMTVGDGVSVVHGLDNAMLGELILFPGDVYGMVMNLDEDSVGVTLLGNADEIKEGDEVRRTGKIIEVPVGDAMLGRVVNPLGQPIDGQGEIITTKTRPIERVAPGVMTRKSVDQPVQTGITTIDAIIPVGRGQRELIIGDRQTGKTAIAVDTIINQKGQDMYCIYVAIGQKNSTVAQVVEKLKKAGAMDYTVVVSASASELAPVQYIAPYAYCACFNTSRTRSPCSIAFLVAASKSEPNCANDCISSYCANSYFKFLETCFIALICAVEPTRDTDKPVSMAGLKPALNNSCCKKI